MWGLGSFYFIFVSVLLRMSSAVPTHVTDNDEVRLRQMLFPKMDIGRQMRPSPNHNETIVIDILLDIAHVRSLDESTGTITVTGLMKMSWTDKTYRWDPHDFGGIKHLTLAYDTLWTPDISAYNSAESGDIKQFGHSSLHLNEDGSIHWLPQVTFWTTCPMDHRLFPFDEQHCDIVLGSWTHDTSTIQLQLAEEHNNTQVTLLEFFTENPQWELFNVVAKPRHLLPVECCSEPYNVVEYKLQLRRRASLQKILFVVPCLVATLLTLALYWLPPNATEKITLGGIILVVQVALLLFMGWYIPQGGPSVPVMVLYCGNTLILTGLTVIVSIIVINMSRSRNYRTPAPATIKLLVTGPLGKLLCIGSHHFQNRQTKLLDENHVELGDTNNHMVAEHSHEDHFTSSYTDWILVATVIDRSCFILYCIAILVIVASAFSN